MKIILGDIAYPKSEILVIPANSVGSMKNRIQKRILKDGWKFIEREAKKVAKSEKCEIGDFFITDPGRLKRRGTKKIYHLVIKKLPNDLVSIDSVRKGLSNILKEISKKSKSVTIGALGTEPGELDKRSVARIILEISDKFNGKIDIKIIDDDKEFINNLEEIYEEYKKLWGI